MDAVETMAWAESQGVPWHGLGDPVGDCLTPIEMCKASGTFWDVVKVPAFIEYNGKQKLTGQEALVRSTDGKILTNVGPNWEPVQNTEAFEFFDDFVKEGHMMMDTAGSLKGGQIVWALAKVGESFSLFGGDEVDSYLLFSNPHQYGKSIEIRFTPIRVVCWNTLTLSLSTASINSVSLSHRRKFDPDAIKEMMGLASTKLDTYKQTAEFLGSKRFTSETLLEYLDEIFPVTGSGKKDISKNAEAVFEIVSNDNQPGAKHAPGSWWQAFNGVTFHTDHNLSRTADKRLENAWFGGVARTKVKALEKAVEFAEAA